MYKRVQNNVPYRNLQQRVVYFNCFKYYCDDVLLVYAPQNLAPTAFEKDSAPKKQ